MKKLFVLLFVLLLAFAVGCAQKTVVDQQPSPAPATPAESATPETSAPATPAAEPEVGDEPEDETPVVVAEPEDDDGYDFESIPKSERRQITTIRGRMDKALGKDENYFYRYTGPDQYQYEYWVKGDKLKVQVLEEDQLDKTTVKNVVFMDRSEKSAAWYCVHEDMNFCYSGPGPWPATMGEFYRKTPKEWLVELGQDFRYRFNDQIQGITYNIIDYTIDGRLVRVWLDSWNGYPFQIDFHPDLDSESEPDKSYKFEDMEIGELEDDDVTPEV